METFAVKFGKLIAVVALVTMPMGVFACARDQSSEDRNEAQERIFTPSELNAQADQYNGKNVYVRGWVVIGYEEFHIWDSKAAHDQPWTGNGKMPNACISYLGDISDRTPGRMEILYGKFWKDLAKSLNVYDLGTCNWSGLEVRSREMIKP